MSENPPSWGQPGYPSGGRPAGPYGAGYPPAGAGGYPQQGPSGGYLPPGPPRRKSSAFLVGIVVAAVVLLVAVGGVVMALTRGGGDQPSSSITPGKPVPPTDQPSGSEDPTEDPTEPPASQPPGGQPPSSQPSQGPQNPRSGPISLGQGIGLTPASGWQLVKRGNGQAQLSNGRSVFAGLVGELDPGSNPVQFCDSYHRGIAKKATNGKFSKAEPLDLSSSKLTGARCTAQVTVTSGQGSSDLLLYSVVSIRRDGVTVVGTLYFAEANGTQALSDDFTLMVGSMLKGQVEG